jgi:hypothetical protein
LTLPESARYASRDARLNRGVPRAAGTGEQDTGIMTRLEDAQNRLERALARLEAAAGKTRKSAGAADDLSRELAAAKQRCATLEEREREMSRRLDAAIGRLRGVLDG